VLAKHTALVDVEERPGAQRTQHEPEQIILPKVEKMAKPAKVVKSARPPRVETRADLDIELSVTQPASYNQVAGNVLPQPRPYSSLPTRKPLLSERAIPFILTVSCIIFLLASSILAFSL